MSREKTEKEIKKEFLNYVRMLIDYWDTEVTDNNKTIKERLHGLAFSILATIDGESTDFPMFILAPNPHENDKFFNISRDKNYFPENDENNIEGNISGNLHHEL